MNEKLEILKIELEKLFDKVVIENDSAPDIRLTFEQNGHICRKAYPKKVYEKYILECDLKKFASGIGIDVIEYFLYAE